MKVSRTGVLVSALPGAAMLALFYSLAVHMRYSLGAWPTSIGHRGFPSGLITHGQWAWNFCGILMLASLWLVPIAILVCLLVRSWRRFTIYFGIYALPLRCLLGPDASGPGPIPQLVVGLAVITTGRSDYTGWRRARA
jgi:hypothetical protein